jgi:hypothetical protein
MVVLQNDHNKLPLAMQLSMRQQLQDVYSSNANQHARI